jgi:hypothetical protein
MRKNDCLQAAAAVRRPSFVKMERGRLSAGALPKAARRCRGVPGLLKTLISRALQTFDVHFLTSVPFSNIYRESDSSWLRSQTKHRFPSKVFDKLIAL